MKRFMMWMIAAATLGAGAAAMAQGPPPRMPHGPPPGHQDRLAAALGLSDSQKAAWEAARKDAHGTMRGLGEQARGLARELDGLLNQPSPDPAAVGAKAIALHDVQGRMRSAHEALDTRLVATLTPEQKLRFEGFQAAQHGPGGPGRGMGDGMWPLLEGPGGPGPRMGPGMHPPGMPGGPQGGYPPAPLSR